MKIDYLKSTVVMLLLIFVQFYALFNLFLVRREGKVSYAYIFRDGEER